MSNLDNKNNIEAFDELFKQGLEQASVPAPPSTWSGIQSATQGATGSGSSWLSKFAGIKGAAVISTLVVTAGALLYLNVSNNEERSSDSSEEIQTKEYVKTRKNKVAVSEVNDSTVLLSSEDDGVLNYDDSIGAYNEGVGEITFAETDWVYKDAGLADNQVAKLEENTEEIEETGELDLIIKLSSSVVCLGETIHALVSPQNGVSNKQLVWKLDGRIVRSTAPGIELYCSNPGPHKLALEVFENKTLVARKLANFDVKSASSEFTWEQVNGGFKLQAKRPLTRNKWYVNHLLENENQQNLFVTADPGQTVKVVHIATSVQGCSDTTEEDLTMEVKCEVDLDVPNVFTPYTKDGNNDEFSVRISSVDHFRMTIYNSSNEVVFETKNPDVGWQGKLQNQGPLLPGGWYTCLIRYGCDKTMKTNTSRVLLVE